ncbi:cysteine--tRNA ligase [Rhabdothermincola sediminis]|uniref:cysteine--tRNA ligase n=1 Tax=Rhabdothermincola sediminis TaxID=2751370 RepID=UPI001AA047B8|nr:cysteine--tRNA ligase [Rhabdothermincola sediminis]
MLRLFDTAEGRVVPLELRDDGVVSMYVCGPTVYGPPHLGHGRFSLVFDVLRRYLEWSGLEVRYVSNITDIDDKIIQRANDEGRSAQEVAEQYEQVWYQAMDAIGVKRPTEDPHATGYVDRMVELIAELMDRGVAYETSDGVYFDPSGVSDYGLLARQSIDSLRVGARVEANEEKRSPIDFALWKKAKPGEPAWPSPWGPGRPGWHTECVVMSLDLLGDGFDLHGGGQDLAFPHHENERAQAVAAGHTFAHHWMHNGFVEVGGEKMSKSLGNFTNLLDLVESTDPRSYRLLVLQSHYRSPVEVNKATIDAATSALERLDAFARRTADLPPATPDAEALDAFRRHMDDDLDTPAAMDVLFSLVRRGNQALDAGDVHAAAAAAAAVREVCRAVGLELHETSGEVPPEVLELARQRDDARARKDWASADALRDQIQARGFVVEDTPAGTQVRPA